jgi:hypothetical protein
MEVFSFNSLPGIAKPVFGIASATTCKESNYYSPQISAGWALILENCLNGTDYRDIQTSFRFEWLRQALCYYIFADQATTERISVMPEL